MTTNPTPTRPEPTISFRKTDGVYRVYCNGEFIGRTENYDGRWKSVNAMMTRTSMRNSRREAVQWLVSRYEGAQGPFRNMKP